MICGQGDQNAIYGIYWIIKMKYFSIENAIYSKLGFCVGVIDLDIVPVNILLTLFQEVLPLP